MREDPSPIAFTSAPTGPTSSPPHERAIYDTLDPSRIPQHVAIIMDGNGRWAGKRALKRFLGHQQGAESVQYVVETASRIDLPWLTLYAFSLENNLRRPKSEVSFLMKLLKNYLVSNVKRMNDNNIRMAYIGRTHELPTGSAGHHAVGRRADRQEHRHHPHPRAQLRLPLRDRRRRPHPRPQACSTRPTSAASPSKTCSPPKASTTPSAPASTSPRSAPRNLYTGHMPDPDLVIRTSGEQRISNFLLWQIAYAEIFVTDRLWPDFRGLHLLEAIADYQHRERRFGGLGGSSDENLSDTLEPASQVAEEILTELSPEQLARR